MASFKTIECDFEEATFFTSGAYTTPSYSSTWATREVPDSEALGGPVYIQVLNKYNIPINDTTLPPLGQLPGVDIFRMDAMQAIKLSLAEALTVGEWWDIYEDGEGGVFFQKVYDNGSPGKTVSLNIRACVPSASKDNEVDMVIVEGYDPPPERYLGPFREVVPAGTGPINPENITGDQRVFTVSEEQLFSTTCHGKMFATAAHKSYKDPVITEEFGGQEVNPFYDIKADEQLIGYVHRITGAGEGDPSISYEVTNTSPWIVPIQLPQFERVDTPGCTVGLPTGEDIIYYEGRFTFNGPSFADKYGFNWPLVIKPMKIFTLSSEVHSAIIRGSSSTGFSNSLWINAIPKLEKLGEGTNWVWDILDDNSFEIIMYYQPKGWLAELWEFASSQVYNDKNVFYTDGLSSVDPAQKSYQSASGGVWIPGTKLGRIVHNAWLMLEVRRPSVSITSKSGDALSVASSLKIEYAPLIKKDPQAPLVYHHKDFGTVVVDRTEGLADNDPTTCQNFQLTEEQIMQDRMQGNVVNVKLPFCATEQECITVAETIFNYMQHSEVQTYTLNVSPDDDPELGAHVEGFPTNLRIQSINYSFNDGSAYTVSVTLGPVFSNIGSWNNGAWIRKTQDVSREAYIVWSAGDGTNYRVKVQGLGYFNAVNFTDNVFRTGELVTVNVKNIPQEE